MKFHLCLNLASITSLDHQSPNHFMCSQLLKIPGQRVDSNHLDLSTFKTFRIAPLLILSQTRLIKTLFMKQLKAQDSSIFLICLATESFNLLALGALPQQWVLKSLILLAPQSQVILNLLSLTISPRWIWVQAPNLVALTVWEQPLLISPFHLLVLLR